MATLLLARISWAYLSTGQYKRGTNVTSQPPLIYLLHISFSIPSSKDEWSVECQGYWLYLASEDTDYIGFVFAWFCSERGCAFPMFVFAFPVYVFVLSWFCLECGLCISQISPPLARIYLLGSRFIGTTCFTTWLFLQSCVCNTIALVVYNNMWNILELILGRLAPRFDFFALLDPRYICRGCL